MIETYGQSHTRANARCNVLNKACGEPRYGVRWHDGQWCVASRDVWIDVLERMMSD